MLFCDSHRAHVLALGQVLAGVGGQENGEFRDFSPRFMAVTLLGSLEAIPRELFAHPGTDVGAHAKELSMTYDLAVRRSRLSRIGRG